MALAEIELQPDLTAAYLLKADLQQRRGDLSGAEQTVRKLLDLDSGNVGGRARLAKLMALLKRSRVDLEHALGEAQTVLSADPGNTDAMTARAEAELGLNRLEEARKDFEALHSKSPDNVFYSHRLGTVAALEGEPDLALKYFHEVLEKNPNLADVINDIVAVMQQQGKTQEILDELDRIAATSDQKALVHTLKGRTYMARQEYERAEAELRQAVELDPDNYQAYLLLGQLRLQENRYDDAVKEVDALLARKPNFAPAYLMKAYFRDAAKDVPGAIQNYRKCLELFAEDSPGYAAAANNLAWLLATKGQSLAEARTLAEKAREEDPDNPHYADTLGWVYYQMGNYTLAVDQLVFSVNQGNRDAPHYYRLGMAYYKMGDALHAKQTLEKALQTSSDFDGADEARQTLRDLGA
ncbi:MAG: tetratricopeptide repeat protein [Acidobacteriota bacterium]